LLISIHPNIIASVAPIGERRCRWSLSGIAVFCRQLPFRAAE
jgi:hypothetical protein